jgi:hypothetical protein
VVAIILQLLLLAVLSPGALGARATGGLIRSCGARFDTALLVTEAGFAVSVLVWTRWVSHARLAALGRPRRPVVDIVTGVLTGGLLVILGYVVLELVVVVYTDVSSSSAMARSAPLVAPLFIVGMGLALIYERRQSLLASMAAHAAFNLAGFIGIALSRR